MWVNDPNEVETFVILSACDSTIRVKGKNLLEALKVLISYRFYTEA